MSGLSAFIAMKILFVGAALGFAVRELWLLRHFEDDPELTKRMLRVFGDARPRAAPPAARPSAPTPAPDEAEPEPLRRAA